MENYCDSCGCPLADNEDTYCDGCAEDYYDDRTYEERYQDDLEEQYNDCHCGSIQLLDNGKFIRVADCIC